MACASWNHCHNCLYALDSVMLRRTPWDELWEYDDSHVVPLRLHSGWPRLRHALDVAFAVLKLLFHTYLGRRVWQRILPCISFHVPSMYIVPTHSLMGSAEGSLITALRGSVSVIAIVTLALVGLFQILISPVLEGGLIPCTQLRSPDIEGRVLQASHPVVWNVIVVSEFSYSWCVG